MSNLSINTAQYSLNSAALSASAVSSTQSPAGLSATQDVDGDGGIQGVGPASSTRISKQSQLFSQLQKLQTQDPAKFKQVLTDAADKLSAAAASATGADKQALTDLAAKFTKAAGGDLSALQPPQKSATNPVQAAYQQGAQTSLDGSTLNPLAQTTASSTNDPSGQAQSTAPGAAGGGHHHHGGHSKLSASTKQTIDSVFQSLDSALGSSASTTDPTSTTAGA